MNKTIISGRWTADPKTSSTAGDNPMTIAKGSIAVDRRGKDKGADFISVVAFGKIADHIGKYYTKGMRTVIAGHIQTGSYTGKDGKKVYTTDVVIDEIEFGESKKASAPTKAEEPTEKADEGFMNVPDDDTLPFNGG